MPPSSTLHTTLPLLLFTIAAGTASWASFGTHGILVNRTLSAEAEAVEARLAERRATIASLRAEIHALEHDPAVQERWVRQELGYVRPGELVYLFPDDRDADFSLLSDRELLRPGETSP